MRILYTFILALMMNWCFGQEMTITFEDFDLPIDSFLNGSDGLGRV